jgi:cAMP-specific phosphodiesterase 4
MLYQCFQYHKELTSVYNEEERFYAILAGLAHDLNHPGTNNAFEVKTKSSRAL